MCTPFVDDDYDEYGRSLEDDEPLSPNTAGMAFYLTVFHNYTVSVYTFYVVPWTIDNKYVYLLSMLGLYNFIPTHQHCCTHATSCAFKKL